MDYKRLKVESFLNGMVRLKAELITLLLKRGFGSFGKGSIFFQPLRIDGTQFVHIGDNVTIRPKSWLCVLYKASRIVIGNGAYIGHLFHCVAMGEITIGEKVLIADKVFLSDNSHGFPDANVPFMDNPIEFKGKVSIGNGTWIGENVCILGASVGSNCIIGSNSVVLNDIPDFSIAAGSPAKVIKRYDHEQKQWNKV
jgi:acetyltransferase-like isoleucine patch superfamily enzyme